MHQLVLIIEGYKANIISKQELLALLVDILFQQP